MTDIGARLDEEFGAGRVARLAPLAPWTTFKVGGPADWLLTVDSADEVKRAVAIAGSAAVQVTVLVGGSNVLVADTGVRGLVLRVHGGGRRRDRSHRRPRSSTTGSMSCACLPSSSSARCARTCFCDSHRMIGTGPTPLRGRHLDTRDLRSGMALITAALAAEGESVIGPVETVERGYASLVERLEMLGAQVVRE